MRSLGLRSVHSLFSALDLLIQLNILVLGENFNYCAILDDYDIGAKIGEGGFGYVLLGTHKQNKKQVAIKFMDVTEYCK